MANKIILKRSSVAAKVPLSTDLDVGELAVNLADAKLYSKNAGGTVIELGGGGGASVTISDTSPSSPGDGDLWWDSTIGQLRIYYNDGTSSQWVDAMNIAGPQGEQGDPGVGVPAGGTTGQYLRKASSTDYDAEWAAIPDDDLYYRKNSSTTLSSSTSNQSWLGLSNGVTVQANTAYEFEGHFELTTSGTTSHTERLLFGLTGATVSNIDYTVLRTTNSTSAASPIGNHFTSASVNTVTGSITTAQDVTYKLKGTVAFTVGGQFNPQIAFSAAPGGTSTISLGALFKMKPIGATGSNSSNGTWS